VGGLLQCRHERHIAFNERAARCIATVQEGWRVDISMAAAPGPGPVWFHEEFTKVEDAVDAIEGCFFADRIDSQNESLERWCAKHPAN
jgi:hypothetical protein